MDKDILKAHEVLENAKTVFGGAAMHDGTLIAPNEEMAKLWREAYPGRKILTAKPLPTTGNPPNRKGRPQGL